MINRRMPDPGKRLSAAIALAPGCRVFADIGADHGRLSLTLLHAGCERGLVTDISAKALDKARRLLSSFGENGKARFAVSDGLEALEDFSADTVFILGMGGDTIAGILERGTDRLNGADLVLGGQTELPLLRRQISRSGYRIEAEKIVWENGRFYLLIKACPAREDAVPTERELFLGPCLLRDRPPEWPPYLRKQEKYYSDGIRAMETSEKDQDRLSEFRKCLEWIRSALALYEKENSRDCTGRAELVE